MTFIWMDMLWLLLAVPALVGIYILMLRAQEEDRAALRQSGAWSNRRWARGRAGAGICRRRCC